jgi:GDP-4-dehydro-6-deoxy-D-mannose reductase
MKKALITGISGFAGSFLAELLLTEGFDVSGTHIGDDTKNLDKIKKDVTLGKVNLLNAQDTKKFIGRISPDYVFHLAALTSPSESFKDPAGVVTNNVTAEINVFEAVRLMDISPKILITSSAEVYGVVSREDLPLNENAALKPGTPYAVSKITQDYLGLQYNISYNMDIIRVRPFNHIGPRQTTQFVVSAFAKQIAELEKSHDKNSIKVGNLEAKRDFTDVRDMVKAYFLLLEKGKSGEVYNAGLGHSHKIGEILEKLLSLSTKKIAVEIDPSRLRPSDVPDIYSDNSKIESETGWKAEIPIAKTLTDTLNYWRENT